MAVLPTPLALSSLVPTVLPTRASSSTFITLFQPATPSQDLLSTQVVEALDPLPPHRSRSRIRALSLPPLAQLPRPRPSQALPRAAPPPPRAPVQLHNTHSAVGTDTLARRLAQARTSVSRSHLRTTPSASERRWECLVEVGRPAYASLILCKIVRLANEINLHVCNFCIKCRLSMTRRVFY